MKLTRQHHREARLLWAAVTSDDGVPDAERIREAARSLKQRIGRDAEPVLRCLGERLSVYLRSARVHVVSAEPLSQEQRDQLAGTVGEGIEFSVDPSVLGGMRLEQGYAVTDRTLARQLDVLKDTLLNH